MKDWKIELMEILMDEKFHTTGEKTEKFFFSEDGKTYYNFK